nr:hypothetical protein [uncultured Anaerostipes sp.]
MPKWIIRGILSNLEAWISIEENEFYRSLYIQFYELFGKQYTA